MSALVIRRGGGSAREGSFERLRALLAGRLGAEQLRVVERAHATAAFWHRDQSRHSGDPYITHPVAVAAILADLGADHELLCAALLHDVLRDTACPAADLERDFGPRIAALVRDLGRLEECAEGEHTAVEWERCADRRVLTLKLADRLHNQRTMRWISPAKQHAKSLQTLRVFAPAAARLGMRGVERELRRLAEARLSALARDGVRVSFGVVEAAAIMLPSGVRGRWLEEWLGELRRADGRVERARFVAGLLGGMPRMAIALRRRTTAQGRTFAGRTFVGTTAEGRMAEGRMAVGRTFVGRTVAGQRIAAVVAWVGAAGRGVGARASRVLRWVLATDARVCAVLGPPLLWLTADAAATRLADAVTLLITVPPVLASGVRALRERLGVPPSRRPPGG
ncbi:HD domain-containing protein [Nonomuraea rhodomycinica]|uniref:HD domain-containing protein n=1 Tax=Nonomuraea rhodomycinica TaxID=1712872 RepID=A0A7Y6IKE0_9ACTN|nr:HD domain-containing protein [Nonomuraea rhodomycinica]NUW39733.1 HD domain-containing protein [Nonomuraea rhodomycinica]